MTTHNTRKPDLYRNDYFYIRVVNFRDPVLEELVEGYGIFSIESNVREAEFRRFHYARQVAGDMEKELRIYASKQMDRLATVVSGTA